MEKRKDKKNIVMHLEELSWKQIDELDRNNTIFFYPISPMEEHGPHLPVGTDFITARDTAEEAIRLLHDKKPEVKGILIPPTPIGYSKINSDFPGTITVSPKVVREVVYSVISALGSQGFRYLVICTFHMGLGHLKGIYQAMKMGRRKYGMHICEPWGPYFYSDRIFKREPKLGFDTTREVHGGFRETSLMKYQYPYLLDESYKELQSIYRDLNSLRVYGKTFKELGLKEGYIGSPARADADYGRWYFNEIVSIIVEETCNLYDGKPISDLPKNIKRIMKLVF